MDFSKFSWENLAQLNKNLQCQISVLKEERRTSDKMKDLLENQIQILTETHHQSIVSQQKGLSNGILISNLVETSKKRGLDEQENDPACKRWQESFQLMNLIYSAKPAKKPLRVFKSGSLLFVLRPDLLDVLSLKNTRLIHLSKAKVDPKDFLTWCKSKTNSQLENNDDFKVGTKIEYFYAVDRHLVSLLEKYSDTSKIADALRVLI